MDIELLQPKPFDLVSGTILISGNTVAFEGTLSISVSDGHDEITGFTMVGATSVRQFQGQIEIPADAAFQLNRLFLTVSDDTAGGGETLPPMVTVPIFHGPSILADYFGYREYRVQRGDTLSALAQRFYDDREKFGAIQAANAHVIEDPNRIFPGQLLRIPVAA